MPFPTRLLALVALLVSATAIVPPGHQGLPNQPVDNVPAPKPDNDLIAQTAGQVDQKAAPPVDAPPNADVPPTGVTTVNGTITNTTIAEASAARRRDVRRFGKRLSRFEKVFDGKPAGQHNTSIEGTAYPTYTVVPNPTYNVQACLDWAATIDGCVFVNLYYKFNNELLDHVFSEKSNLKCAAYGDLHKAAEKTNFGGQASYSQVSNETVPLTYITQSSGWGLDDLVVPDTPDGYELVFGPTGGANNAPGYMGFPFLERYDVDTCAALCNGRGVDPNGGGCAYFNIWCVVVNGVPTTYTCSMYYLVADESTAVNYGQGDLVMTLSRGYRRKDLLTDGGFEGYTACNDFCFTASYANWIGISPAGGDLNASIFFFPNYAHTGHGSGLLGAAFGDDNKAGTLAPAHVLQTNSGASYVVQAFVSSAFSGASLEAGAKIEILWNGQSVVMKIGFTGGYVFTEASVVAASNDKLSFAGGAAPAWTFIDDVHVYKA
ncbi:hypothetical protein B0H14DRAFT_3589771 [Mycena olivaceomarginata]|nr:hypothetical protein B0H14DRAFT_3589771 [Mycena olivaceomarginata]